MKNKTLFLLVSVVAILVITSGIVQGQDDYNYVDALNKSILFYEANWCGPDAGDNRLKWRGPCHTEDGSDVDLDLTGGFHDAGDHVKFGQPQGYSASVLTWVLHLYEDTLKEKEQYDYLYNIAKHFAEYFIRSHPEDDIFYYQVGEGEDDHSYWGPPELQSEDRPAYAYASPNSPGSQMTGSAAASLALMSMVAEDEEPEFSDEALENAKSIYELGKNYPGDGEGQSFYNPGPFWDELCWAAVWLYQATGDESYMNDIDDFMDEAFSSGSPEGYQNNWTLCWDDVWAGVFMELYRITEDEVYQEVVEDNFDYWMNDIETTPGGLSYLESWGSLRYAAAEAMLAMVYYDMSGEEKYRDYAKSQIDYMLGSNPRDSSYLVGFGENYPEFPHHRAASGRLEGPPADEKKTMPQKHVLYGALVGGPQSDDSYEDDIEQYEYTEVAIDYNAGFVGAITGMAKHFGEDQEPEEIPQEPEEDEIFVEAALEEATENEISLLLYLYNESIHPPRYEDELKFRYYMDLSEVYEQGYTAEDVDVNVKYNENEGEFSGIQAYDEEENIYYVEVDFSGIDLYAGTEVNFSIESHTAGGLDVDNDFSGENLTKSMGKQEKIPIYRDKDLIYGQEPGNDNETEIIYGDLDGDEKVTSQDFFQMVKYIFGGITEFTGEDGEEAADLNDDDTIDSMDLSLLQQHLLGKSDEFPVER